MVFKNNIELWYVNIFVIVWMFVVSGIWYKSLFFLRNMILGYNYIVQVSKEIFIL